jgi:hypothetical protein
VTLENSKLVPTVHFPWDYLVAAGIGLVSFFWAVQSAFETEELQELHIALSEGRPLSPVPETEATWKPLHAADPTGGEVVA